MQTHVVSNPRQAQGPNPSTTVVDESAETVHHPSFQAAWELIDLALSERQAIAEYWHTLSETNCFDSYVRFTDDEHGRIDVTVTWPDGVLEQASTAAANFVQAIRGALDQSIVAAAKLVSGVVEAPLTQTHTMPRFRSVGDFAAAVADGWLRGLRPDQIKVVEQFQPYLEVDPHTDAATRLIRHLMAHLAAMTDPSRDDHRSRIAVWAHSASPVLEVDAPGSLVELSSTGDGVMTIVYTAATFKVFDADTTQVRGNPDIAFDLIFNDEPMPLDPDDNLMRRSTGLAVIASEFIRGVERSVGVRPPLRLPTRPDSSLEFARPTTWGPLSDTSPDAKQVASALADSDIGLALHTDADGHLTVLFRSGDGTYSRPIPDPISLDPNIIHETAAENASLAAVQLWGLPDFVMRPQLSRKGTASREIGDGTVIVGRRALAIQVKARQCPSGKDERERGWLEKKTAEGARQARGTVRTLRTGIHELTNCRGRAVRCDATVLEWVGVVIIEHDSPPAFTPVDLGDDDLPVLVLLRRDWDFLFDQLRSVSAVTDYVHRVCGDRPINLGSEPLRYFKLAQADEDATPDGAAWEEPGAAVFSSPLLPKSPATAEDSDGHAVFRLILEEIARADIDQDENDRLDMLAMIDRFNIAGRSELGRLLLRHLEDVAAVKAGETMWRFRRVIQDSGLLQLAFGACSQFTEPHSEAFRQWAMMRHHEFCLHVPEHQLEGTATVAVLLTPRYASGRPWDTTMLAIRGPLHLEPDELTSMRKLWNR